MLGYYTGKGLVWKWSEPLGRGGGQSGGQRSGNLQILFYIIYIIFKIGIFKNNILWSLKIV